MEATVFHGKSGQCCFCQAGAVSYLRGRQAGNVKRAAPCWRCTASCDQQYGVEARAKPPCRQQHRSSAPLPCTPNPLNPIFHLLHMDFSAAATGGVTVHSVRAAQSATHQPDYPPTHPLSLPAAVDLLPRGVSLHILFELPRRLQAKVLVCALRGQQPEPIVAGLFRGRVRVGEFCWPERQAPSRVSVSGSL